MGGTSVNPGHVGQIYSAIATLQATGGWDGGYDRFRYQARVTPPADIAPAGAK